MFKFSEPNVCCGHIQKVGGKWVKGCMQNQNQQYCYWFQAERNAYPHSTSYKYSEDM